MVAVGYELAHAIKRKENISSYLEANRRDSDAGFVTDISEDHSERLDEFQNLVGEFQEFQKMCRAEIYN